MTTAPTQSTAQDHLALYRPGTGSIWILRNDGGTFAPVYQQGDPGVGIGGYALASFSDRAFAFDYDGSGLLDHIVLYRPGTGTIWIVRNDGGTFTAVYQQGDPRVGTFGGGGGGGGIGGYNLTGNDRAFAFDYDSSGLLDHMALYRPGTGTMWILKNEGGTFSPVYQQGAPGNGIGGYDLSSGADRVFAFDYDGSGKLDHLVLYRPGTGTVWILGNDGGNFAPVYRGNGIGGYDLGSGADRAFAFDYDGSGRLDHIALYRPGSGTVWILKNEGGTFSPVYQQGGIGGYDLGSGADRAFAFDYDGSGKLDHIALYRPGTGTMWILKNEGGAFSPVYQQGDPGSGIGGYDLGSSADLAFALASNEQAPQPLSAADLEQAIRTYGPVVRFHPQEQYNMCSVEAFLGHAKLHDNVAGTDLNHPTESQLPTGPTNDHRYWLILEDAFKGGDLSTAKAYVRAYWRPGMSYTDLQFWMLYAYNGPGTAHVNGLVFDTIAHTGDPGLAPMGEHYGDWECCMVRIDNTSKQMIGAWLSQHADGQMLRGPELNQLARVNGQQIVLYSSLNGHALYPSVGSNYTEKHKYPDPAIPAGIELFLRNDTADGGATLNCGTAYQVISAEWLGNAYPVPNWVEYPYRWGPEGTTTHLTPSAVSDILEAALGWLSAFTAALPVMSEYLLSIYATDDLNGPSAPKTQGTWTGTY